MIITLKEALEKKLEKELVQLSKRSKQSYLEDIWSVLALSEWSEEEIPRLLQTPNLLREVALTLQDDDVFLDFFEQRVKDLTLELVEK
ncbi:MAG: hypothetical protein FWE12_01440 [Oscillospiraceae bacterium]|nr:hypothetical protein [Oscillospiraceae bacterium]